MSRHTRRQSTKPPRNPIVLRNRRKKSEKLPQMHRLEKMKDGEKIEGKETKGRGRDCMKNDKQRDRART